jgi:hypothetical protein
MDTSKKLFGIAAIFGIPLLYVLAFSLQLMFPQPNTSLVVLFLLILLIFWVYWMIFYSNPYGPQQITQVTLNDVDKALAEILTETDRRGQLLNLNIIMVFEDDKNHTRKELFDEMEKRKVQTSQPTIATYVKNLVTADILTARGDDPYNRPYALTQTGKLCLWAAQTYFPATNLFFYWRHYVGVKGKRKH